MTPLQLFAQQLANGFTIGSIYALIALGYTMVYGVIQLINFAHGEVFMVGAYLALTCVIVLGITLPLVG
ncbi:MAG: branched-chain amino acid ABC transporter permease, partial [Candidatus Omnitrophica bacterium]|nr:branched-chain amino acid ABC transporter permease [Candidatus Omnitrophota bacterium]